LPPSVLPDISPTRVEIGLHHAFRETAKVIKIGGESAAVLISPLVGEMSGRTEGGVSAT
jgi:hypothetical protein